MSFLQARLTALQQCDDQGLGFYDRLPIYIRCTAQLHFKAQRLPDFSTMVKWVFALFDGRLWYKRPVCLGFEGQILRVPGQKQIGTEIVLERRDI